MVQSVPVAPRLSFMATSTRPAKLFSALAFSAAEYKTVPLVAEGRSQAIPSQRADYRYVTDLASGMASSG